jgi:Leucine-rich repeat (LRR) protein
MLITFVQCKNSVTQTSETDPETDIYTNNEVWAEPNLIFPEKGSEQPASLTFKWEEVEEVELFQIRLAMDENFNSIIADSTADTTAFDINFLPGDTTFYWQVRTVDEGEEGSWSEVWNFSTVSYSSAAKNISTDLRTPTDGTEVDVKDIELKWESVARASGYNLQLAEERNFNSLVIDKEIEETLYQISDLDGLENYYWRVEPIVSEEDTKWSDVYSFSTMTEATNDTPNSIEGDRRALMDLYEATGGDSWHNNSGWGSGDPSGSWHGIEVNAEGRVVRVDLRANNLSGSLPESLGNLSKVRYFNVKQNGLAGEIPWAGIGQMTELRYLLLNGRTIDPEPASSYHHPGKDINGSYSDERTNNFTGSIGPEVGNLVHLKYLELLGVNSDHTGLTGAIPEEIGNLTSLEGLHLSYNSFSSLPASMGNLTNMLQFDITNSGLSGSLPSWIGNWTRLRYFVFEDNNFTGELPNLSNLSDLRVFVAKKNDFTGSIPGWLFDGSMPHINMVDLAWNEFSGQLPEFGTPNNLVALQVDGNNLSGEIPASVSNLPKMINFGLGWNDFSGELPSLTHMYQLRYIRANDNSFTGTPPMVDTTNEDLRNLHMQNNRMSGEVPAELAEVGHLPIFDQINLSNNNFSEADLQPLIDTLCEDGRLTILVNKIKSR